MSTPSLTPSAADAAVAVPPSIRRAAVIGAGTMGAAIAAHLTNAGVPTVLLDIPADAGSSGGDIADRDAVVQAGFARVLRARPPAVMDPARTAALLTLGNTVDNLHLLADCDWIVEAIIEKPQAKQALWAVVEQYAGPDAIFSSNTSGIPMAVQSQGRGPAFRRRFLGAHFYNPPRYLYLLELIPTPDTDPAVLETVRAFGDRVLGKGIVIAHDVPGFIGNRVGIYALLHTARVAEEMNLSPDVVDALTGPVLGRPKSGTMRLADTVGLDVLDLISRDLTATTDDDFRLPGAVVRLLEMGRKGEKTGGGYYHRRRNGDGTSTILTLDAATMEYTERPAPGEDVLPAAIRKLPTAVERTRALLALDGPAGEFTRRTIHEILGFAKAKLGVVADTAADIDHALEWGFGWETGPFKLIDALGEGSPYYPAGATESGREGLIVLGDLKRDDPARIVWQSAGASLVDLGDGALLLEFHSKANALGADAFAAVEAALEIVPGRFLGLVVGNQGRWFSAGADLAALLKDAETGDVAAITRMIAGFQCMTTSLQRTPFPVVAAPFNMTLGGGCEIMLHCDAVQADAELATGLVELKVGLMPAAGGTTEMLVRYQGRLRPGEEPFDAVARVFDLLTAGKVSGSAPEARTMGYLCDGDGITMNRRRLLGDAKDTLLALAAGGYQPPELGKVSVSGAAGYARLMTRAEDRRAGGEWMDYDVELAGRLARVLTGGGPGSPAGDVPRERLLELEREVFIECCAQPRTHERIRHMLAKGKPLRN